MEEYDSINEIKKKRNHTFLCMSLRKTNRQTLYDK